MAVINNNRSAPIVDQTPDELEVTRLQLQAEQERLDEQRTELARQCEDRKRVEAMRGCGRQVIRAHGMHEKDGIPLFLTPSHNLIAATEVVQSINLLEGTTVHDELRRLKILMEEVAL